jgi:hypothetical protein
VVILIEKYNSHAEEDQAVQIQLDYSCTAYCTGRKIIMCVQRNIRSGMADCSLSSGGMVSTDHENKIITQTDSHSDQISAYFS